jgi:biotin operon repressor
MIAATHHPLSREARALYAALRTGRRNARVVDDLAVALGLPRRAVEKAGAELRDAGYLVGSATTEPAGYYRCATREEGLAVYRALRRRSIGQMARARAVLKAAMRLPVDEELTFWPEVAA